MADSIGASGSSGSSGSANSFTALVNPSAANGRAGGRLLPVARALRAAGATLSVEYSRSGAHAASLAAEAMRRGDAVLAVGGDGTVGAIAGVVDAAGGVLGLIPAGRGNDFARQLGLPDGPEDLAAVLLGPSRPIDVIEVGDRIVLGSVYAGLDSVANEIANRTRALPDAWIYKYAGLRAIVRWQPATYQVTVDGAEHEVRGYGVVVANSGYYGNGLHIAPDAREDDGLLEIVLLGEVSRMLFLRILQELPTGAHTVRPEVRILRGREVRVSANRPVPAYGDGEPVGAALPVTARVRAASLRFLAPPRAGSDT